MAQRNLHEFFTNGTPPNSLPLQNQSNHCSNEEYFVQQLKKRRVEFSLSQQNGSVIEKEKNQVAVDNEECTKPQCLQLVRDVSEHNNIKSGFTRKCSI